MQRGMDDEEDFDINKALPGLLYVVGHCLYGGKVRSIDPAS